MKKEDQFQRSIDEHFLLICLDPAGKILDCNDLFSKTIGITREELFQKEFSHFCTLPQNESFTTVLPILSAGKKWRGEISAEKSSGCSFWLDLALTPMMDNTGKLQEVICIGNDITKSKFIEERYRMVLNGINAAIWDWTNVHEREDYYWSPKMYEMLSYDPAEITPNLSFFFEIVHPDDLTRIQASQDKLLHSNHSFQEEFRVLCGDGEYRWIQSTGTALRDASNNIYRILGTTIDIHQRKVFEHKLELEKQKTVHASKLATLGEMAAGLAHEVNNPLTIIFGYIRILQDEFSGKHVNKEQSLKFLGLIKGAAERAAKLVHGLKDFARDGSHDPFEDCSSAEIVAMVLDLCRERFKKNSIRLEIEISDDPIIQCRKIEISQVILNLLFNSYDAVQDYEEKWVKLQVYKTHENLEIAITDRGEGLPPEVQEKLFTPFFTTKKLGFGTGLGLSISQRIVINHGGEIFYEPSAPHTKFVIRLPLNSALD